MDGKEDVSAGGEEMNVRAEREAGRTSKDGMKLGWRAFFTGFGRCGSELYSDAGKRLTTASGRNVQLSGLAVTVAGGLNGRVSWPD